MSKLLRYSDIKASDVDRFFKFIQYQDDGCWIWGGRKNANGYGAFRFGISHVQAHRFASVITSKEDWQPHQVARHKCNNRTCVNPAHVIRGTQHDNVADSIRSGGRKGRIYTQDDVDTIRVMHEVGFSDREIGESLSIRRSSVWRLRTYGVQPLEADAEDA